MKPPAYDYSSHIYDNGTAGNKIGSLRDAEVRLGARKIRRTADNRPQSKPTRPDLYRARAAAPFPRELRLLALFRLPLSQSDAGAAAVFIDKLDASSL